MNRALPFIGALFLLYVSCSVQPASDPVGPDNPEGADSTSVSAPAAPEQYGALLNEFKKGATLCRISFLPDGSELQFSDGNMLFLPADTMPVEQLPGDTPQKPSVGYGGTWSVGSEDTLIPCDSTVPDSRAYPIYLCFCESAGIEGVLHMFLSNGNSFEMKFERYPVIRGELPKVYITADKSLGSLNKETYIDGKIEIFDTRQVYSSVKELKLETRMRLRGNSTSSMPKKPIRLKFYDKSEVLGMPANKDWNLLANYADKSLLRNMVAMEISRICSMPWTPRMTLVELWFNNAYQGVYNLTEVCEVASERVDIDPDNGDVFLEVDDRLGEEVWFRTESYNIPVTFKDPEHPSDSKKAEIKSLFNRFEKAIAANNGTAQTLSDYRTLADYYIINELTKNVDGNIYLSTFISVKNGGPLVMSNVWDFDLALGNCDYMDDCGPTGWWTKNASWYRQLLRDRQFVSLLKTRWVEVYPDLCHIPEYIDQQRNLIGDAQTRNFNKWKILSIYVWPNYRIPGSYEGEISYLKEFYTTRLKWMDEKIRAL